MHVKWATVIGLYSTLVGSMYVREWQHVNPLLGGADSLRVVQYNVLATLYAPLMDYAPPNLLSWDTHRQPLLVKQLVEWNADVICLQELDRFEQLNSQPHALGYAGEFLKRMGKPDGAAIFYRKDKLRLVSKHTIDLNKAATTPARGRTNNVALLIEFELADQRRVFVVCTHLYWDPKMSDVKIRQAAYIMRQVAKHLPSDARLIVCGDFNSLPDSAVYELLHTGSCAGNHPEMRQYKRDKPFTSRRLASAYAVLGEPLSNFTPKFQGCIDYIWYSPGNIQLLSVLRPPQSTGPFPDSSMPSDHIALVSDFAILDSGAGAGSQPNEVLLGEESPHNEEEEEDAFPANVESNEVISD
eukprot:TRINITY_DN4069_c0_g1_i1.p1 TRINITY_DN4069_c0_g1~~TRINITY_DN4069_c0_g1_i1.p1  ORF type:complete len:356 (-),score=48.81 TRINITY_DN4069_c0_g1_i1:2-1069(-)